MSLDTDLRASLEVGNIALTLAQADAALHGKPMPMKLGDITDMFLRRKYQDAACIALRLLNRDAVLYAEGEAGKAAFEELDRFCSAHGLDWRAIDHPLHEGDAFEMFVYRAAKRATKRAYDVLAGIMPGLSRHLDRLEQIRTTDTDPRLIEESYR